MCLPMVGAVFSAVGSLASASAQSASLKAQSLFNNRQASMEYTKGSYQIALQQRQEERVQAGQKVGFAKGGIDTEQGTPIDLSNATDLEAGLDRQAIRFGRDLTASNYEYKAKIDKMNAGAAMTAGIFSAFSTVLSGATKLGGQFQMA